MGGQSAACPDLLIYSAYDSAEMQASGVINNTALYGTSSLNQVFLKNSQEAIWQVQPVNIGWNTPDAQIFILSPASPMTGTLNPVYLSPQILAAFEPGDRRRTNWIDSVTANGIIYYYPYKYKSATFNAPVTEYEMILRLGEQYLIRAEARARQNNIPGAQADLNLIRTRAGLSSTTANDQSALLAVIGHERQAELFTEWGHRWLDLKRSGEIDAVIAFFSFLPAERSMPFSMPVVPKSSYWYGTGMDLPCIYWGDFGRT